MRRFVAVAAAAVMALSLMTVSAAAGTPTGGWTAPGSGVTIPTGTMLGPPSQVHSGVVSGSGGALSGGPAGRSIEISQRAQRLWAKLNGRVVMTFLISTGRPGFHTPNGRFRIRAKGLNWWSHQWGVWMPYAMNFFSNYNLHSLPHYPGGRLIGASSLGRAASHGCVRIGPANARALYYWAPVGTPVWIHN